MIRVRTPGRLLTIALILMTGCGNGAPPPAESAEAELSAPEVLDTTDRSGCQMATPADTTVFGAWYHNRQDSEGFAMKTIVRVDPSFVTLENECRYEGRFASARIQVPVTVTENRITFHRGDESSEKRSGISCRISLNAGTISYQLTGNCLELGLRNETLVLVRE